MGTAANLSNKTPKITLGDKHVPEGVSIAVADSHFQEWNLRHAIATPPGSMNLKEKRPREAISTQNPDPEFIASPSNGDENPHEPGAIGTEGDAVPGKEKQSQRQKANAEDEKNSSMGEAYKFGISEDVC